MASWSSAFATAFKIFLASILWGIVGLILIILGANMIGGSLTSIIQQFMSSASSSSTLSIPTLTNIDLTDILMGGVLILVGYLILLLGTIASFLKYSAEYYAREIRGPSR